MRRTRQPSRIGHAPAAPRESRRRIERVPVSENMFAWVPGELILGPRPRRTNLASDIGARLQALYGRGEPSEGAE